MPTGGDRCLNQMVQMSLWKMNQCILWCMQRRSLRGELGSGFQGGHGVGCFRWLEMESWWWGWIIWIGGVFLGEESMDIGFFFCFIFLLYFFALFIFFFALFLIGFV